MLSNERTAATDRAARFLKSLAHTDRLRVLCTLVEGERPVAQIEALVGASQSAISQHLARLKQDGIVAARRDGRQIHYRIADPLALRVLALLHAGFCAPEADGRMGDA